MALLRNLLSHRFHSLLKTPHRPITSMLQSNKPLHALFSEAVGLSEKSSISDGDDNNESDTTDQKTNLKQLEQELRTFKVNANAVPKKTERRSLVKLFAKNPDKFFRARKKPIPNKEIVDLKEISPDMAVFLQHLFENGYFRDSNFAKGKQHFDLAWFGSLFAREYTKSAARKFAMDNHEIAKWLSGKALKQVAMFGCPSDNKAIVFSAKRLRKFFEVPENTVCSKCSLQQSCKFVNQSVWKGDTNTLNFEVVMKVITSYALGLVHPQLVVPDEVNKSINHLLKEVVRLSQTT